MPTKMQYNRKPRRRRLHCPTKTIQLRALHLRVSEWGMMRDNTGLSATMADVVSMDSHDEHDSAPHRQGLARKSNSSEVYCNTALTVEAPAADHGPVLVNATVQVPPRDTLSPHPPVVSFPLTPRVADAPVIRETRAIREVEIGPEIYVGYLSVQDYAFIMSLVVIKEEQ